MRFRKRQLLRFSPVFRDFWRIFGLISLLSAPVLIGDFEISRTSFVMYILSFLKRKGFE